MFVARTNLIDQKKPFKHNIPQFKKNRSKNYYFTAQAYLSGSIDRVVYSSAQSILYTLAIHSLPLIHR